jgi:hypothetical protein
MMVNPAGKGALTKQFIIHAASAQDVWQSGTDCFSWGQQFMSSPMDDMSAIAAIEAAPPIAAADGITIGAVERPTIARTESRRKMSDQSFNRSAFHSFRGWKHISQGKKRPSISPPHEIVIADEAHCVAGPSALVGASNFFELARRRLLACSA